MLYLLFIHFIVLCIHLFPSIYLFQGVIHPSQQTKNLVEPTVSKPAVPPPEVWSDDIQRSTSPTYHIDLGKYILM